MDKDPKEVLGDLRRELDEMRSENDEMLKSITGEGSEDGDDDSEGEGGDTREEDPLTEDPRRADSGRALTERLNQVIDDLEWRQIARDKQARVIVIQEDLEKPAAAVRAGWKTDRERAAAMRPPESTESAKQLLGRLLLKCETLIDDVMNDTRETSRFGLATQLVHAAAGLARTMDRIGMDPHQTRHTVKVERDRSGE